MYRFVCISCSLLAATLWTAPARAQQADTSGTGGIIGSINAGALFGLGAHGAAGADLAATVTKHVLPFFEISYSPLTSYGFKYGSNLTGKGLYTSSVLDLNGGIKIRFSTSGNWVPYIGLGAGGLRLTSSTTESGYGATSSVSQTNNEAAGNASVGALYYITQHLGFGAELKGYGAQHTHLFRATMGIFFQIP